MLTASVSMAPGSPLRRVQLDFRTDPMKDFSMVFQRTFTVVIPGLALVGGGLLAALAYGSVPNPTEAEAIAKGRKLGIGPAV